MSYNNDNKCCELGQQDTVVIDPTHSHTVNSQHHKLTAARDSQYKFKGQSKDHVKLTDQCINCAVNINRKYPIARLTLLRLSNRHKQNKLLLLCLIG